ncbi:hypothetical protein FIV42_08745 [Persicimonas caeni]|uniref:Carboxypeptidase regulatory-like domain-containing protein n=1 Tax=Persicimonas caeni TaxID=2292766 RepID=A0A4Y6PSR6_PERCE|nr:hypothetical protein [Persicimonas caeni]QDG50815.1 hypothetical protein FIV42_08745 [Persicimonas caeni]QED32036.1 hypothetical protein FRD00_08740 [Persicimonas caeni]
MFARIVCSLSVAVVLWVLAGCDDASRSSGFCGDGRVSGDEACDGVELGGRDCQSFGFSGGELRCNASCTGYLVSECSGVPDWNGQAPSACFDCSDDEVCVEGRCESICAQGAEASESVAGESLSFDIQRHVVSGQVRMDGQPLTGREPMAELRFINRANRGEFRARVDVLTDREGRYQVELHPGTYDVYVTGVEGFAPVIFAHGEWVASDLVVAGERTLDVDVSGPIHLDMSLDVSQRLRESGALRAVTVERLAQTTSGERYVEVITKTHYDEPMTLTVLPGTYRVRTLSGMLLDGPRTVDEDTSWTVPVDLATVSGQVRLRDDLPQDLMTMVEIRIEGRDEPLVELFLDDGQFSETLVAGDYELRAWVGGLGEDPTLVETQTFSLAGDERIEMTLGEGLVAVRGRVEPVPDQEVPPMVWFTRRGGSPLWHTASVVDGRFETVLPPGDYAVAIDQYEGDRASYLPRTTLRELEVGNTPIDDLLVDLGDIDVRTKVHGTITVDGAPMPDNTLGDDMRGYVAFECLSGERGTCWRVATAQRLGSVLSSAGEAEYEVEIRPGIYRVVLYGGLPTSLEAPHSDALPPGGYVLDPYLEVGDEEMTRDFDMKVVRVSGELTADGGAIPAAEAFSPYVGETYSDETSVFHGPLRVHYPRAHHDRESAAFEFAATGPTGFAFDAFPGQYRFDLSLGGLTNHRRYRHAPGLTRWVEVAEDGDLSWDLPLHHAEVQLTLRGEPWPGEGPQYIVARTALGRYRTSVQADGTATVWWLGEDPTLMYVNHAYLEDRLMVLREGCDVAR